MGGSPHSVSPQSTSYFAGQTPTPSGFTPQYSSVPSTSASTPSFPTGAFIVSHADTESGRYYYSTNTPNSERGGDATAYFDLSTS